MDLNWTVLVTSASLLSHSSSREVEVFDTRRRFLGASISEKNDKADNVGDTENTSQGEWQAHMSGLNTTGPVYNHLSVSQAAPSVNISQYHFVN